MARSSVLAFTRSSTFAFGSRVRAATRAAWMSAFRTEICGSTPEAEVWTASAGTAAFVRPGLYGRSRLRYASVYLTIASRRFFEFGPRLEKAVAAGL
jgi:hypothetical protein